MSNGISGKDERTTLVETADNPAAMPVAAALSRGQRAMWFLWNLNPDGAEYGLPMAWTIRAALDAHRPDGGAWRSLSRARIGASARAAAERAFVQRLRGVAISHAGGVPRRGTLDILAIATGLPSQPGSADRPRPPVQIHAGAGHTFELSQELTRQVRMLAKQEDVTFYTVLLAAFFYVLLYRYTGQDDLVVGSPRFGRPPQGYERTVGYFASPCALRTQLAGDATFLQFLHQVRKVLVGARDHQDFPFPLLVERLGLPRDLSRSPVFQVAFTYQKSQLPHIASE